jgi:hypothetical protein
MVAALESAGIEYMVTGSTVSSLQGEPRATHDIDIVVELSQVGLRRFCSLFPEPEYYLDDQAVSEAVALGGMFNVLHVDSGDKVDFWVLTDEPFDRTRFARKREEHAADMCFVASRPEDTILMKLKWSRLSGGSKKQYVDALRVYEVQGEQLDHEYLERWAAALGVSDLLEQIIGEAESVDGT